MPKSDDVHAAIAMIDVVNHPVGAHDDLAQRMIVEFRHHTSQFGKIREPLRAGDEKLAEPKGALR